MLRQINYMNTSRGEMDYLRESFPGTGKTIYIVGSTNTIYYTWKAQGGVGGMCALLLAQCSCVCVCVCAHDRTKEQQSNGMPLQIALPFVCYVEVIPLWEVVICADEWCWICKDSL